MQDYTYMFIIVYFTLTAAAVSLVNISRMKWKRVLILSLLPPFLYMSYHILLDFLLLFANPKAEFSLSSYFGFYFLSYMLTLPVLLFFAFGVELFRQKFTPIPLLLAIFGAILGTLLLSMYIFTFKFWDITIITGFWSVIICCMICREQ